MHPHGSTSASPTTSPESSASSPPSDCSEPPTGKVEADGCPEYARWHAGLRAVSSQARPTRGTVGPRAIVHPACGHGRVFRFGVIARTSGTARQARGGGRAAGPAWRGFRGELRGAQIRDPFGDAASNGGTALPACSFSGWASRKIWRVERPRRGNTREIFSDRGDGFDRRSVSRSRRHRALAWTAAGRCGQIASNDHANDGAALLRRTRNHSPRREGHV